MYGSVNGTGTNKRDYAALEGMIRQAQSDIEEVRTAAAAASKAASDAAAKIPTDIAAHYASDSAHPSILSKVADVTAQINVLMLMYGTDVSGNPFTVTFNNLNDVTLDGIWNTQNFRVDF